MKTSQAYEEVIDFIASTNPGKVLAFRSSAETKARVFDLIDREKTTGLSPEEKSELDYCMVVEHLMIMAKARARQYLNASDKSASTQSQGPMAQPSNDWAIAPGRGKPDESG